MLIPRPDSSIHPDSWINYVVQLAALVIDARGSSTSCAFRPASLRFTASVHLITSAFPFLSPLMSFAAEADFSRLYFSI